MTPLASSSVAAPIRSAAFSRRARWRSRERRWVAAGMETTSSAGDASGALPARFDVFTKAMIFLAPFDAPNP